MPEVAANRPVSSAHGTATVLGDASAAALSVAAVFAHGAGVPSVPPNNLLKADPKDAMPAALTAGPCGVIVPGEPSEAARAFVDAPTAVPGKITVRGVELSPSVGPSTKPLLPLNKR